MTAGAPSAASALLALGLPDRRSSVILIGLATAFVLLLWWLIRAIRAQGGVRPAWRRLVWEIRTTRRAFTQPVRARRVHRRRVRTLTAYFADPSAPAAMTAALDAAERSSGTGCHGAAVGLSPERDRVAVVVTGRSPVEPVAPWHDVSAAPGGWSWSAPVDSVLPAPTDEATEADANGGNGGNGGADRADEPTAGRLLLALGVDRTAAGPVAVDWADGPPAIGVEGDQRTARSVLQALAAQLERVPGGPDVEVTRGVHARYPGRDLDAVLDGLDSPDDGRDGLVDGAAGQPPVVVCWAPTGEQRARLAGLCASGRVRALVGGARVPGRCWSLHAEPGGRLLGPGLGVDVESAALATAVSRTLRRHRRRGSVPPDAPTPPGRPQTSLEKPPRSAAPAIAPVTTAASAPPPDPRTAYSLAKPGPTTGPPVPAPRASVAASAEDLTEPGELPPARGGGADGSPSAGAAAAGSVRRGTTGAPVPGDAPARSRSAASAAADGGVLGDTGGGPASSSRGATSGGDLAGPGADGPVRQGAPGGGRFGGTEGAPVQDGSPSAGAAGSVRSGTTGAPGGADGGAASRAGAGAPGGAVTASGTGGGPTRPPVPGDAPARSRSAASAVSAASATADGGTGSGSSGAGAGAGAGVPSAAAEARGSRSGEGPPPTGAGAAAPGGDVAGPGADGPVRPGDAGVRASGAPDGGAASVPEIPAAGAAGAVSRGASSGGRAAAGTEGARAPRDGGGGLAAAGTPQRPRDPRLWGEDAVPPAGGDFDEPQGPAVADGGRVDLLEPEDGAAEGAGAEGPAGRGAGVSAAAQGQDRAPAAPGNDSERTPRNR